MKKIIIRDFIDNPTLATFFVSRCFANRSGKISNPTLFAFSDVDKRVIVAVEKNKESVRFDVYEEKNQLFGNPEQLD